MTIPGLKTQIDADITDKVAVNSISPENVGDNAKAIADEVRDRGYIAVANTGALATLDSENTKFAIIDGVGIFQDSATGPANGTTIFAGVGGRFWKKILSPGTSFGSLSVLPDPAYNVSQDTGGDTYKTTAPSVFYAKDYGVVADGVTDDLAAIHAALAACDAAGGGDVILPRGKMIVSDTVKFPLRAYGTSQDMRSIRLMGQMIPNMFSEPLSSKQHPNFGSIIEGNFLGDKAVIDTHASSGAWGDFNFLNITIENLAIRVRSKTAGADVAAEGQGINAVKMAMVQIRNVSISTTSNIFLSVLPLSTSFGVRFPANNNFVFVNANNLFVTGFYYGIFGLEHVAVDNYFADACYYGAFFSTSNHSAGINKCCIARCKYSVGAGPGSIFRINNLSIEALMSGGNWFQNTLDLEASATAVGWINYQRVVSGSGPNNTEFRRSNVPYNVICLHIGQNMPIWATANRPDIIPEVGTVAGFNTTLFYCEVYDHTTSDWIPINGVPVLPDYRDHDLGVNLKAYYDFEEAAGNFLDKSGNIKHLTRFNSATTTTGKIANGAGLSGASSQYLKSASGAGLSRGAGLSICGWVNLDNTGGAFHVIIQKGLGGTFDFEYNLFQSAGNLNFSLSTNGLSGGIVGVTRPLLRDSAWHFIDARWDGATMYLRVDNGTAATAAIASVFAGSGLLHIGGDPAPANFMSGKVDEIAIFDSYMSDAFMTNLYNAGAGRTIGTNGGGILFAGSDGLPAHDLRIFWDNTNKILGISTPTVLTQFDKTNTTLADVPGLTKDVVAGKRYKFEAILYTTSDVAGGVKAAIGGTATATSIIYEAETHQGGVPVATGTQRSTALGTAVGNVTAVTTAKIKITGTIVVNAAGTLTVQFAENAATATSSVLIGSVFEVKEIL